MLITWLRLDVTSTSSVWLPLQDELLYVFPNCKSLRLKASAKWLNVNVNVNDKMGGMPLIEFILECENRSPIILCTICKLHIRYIFVWQTINFVISAKLLNRKFTHKWKLCHYLLTLMLVQPIWPSFVEILDLSFTNKISDWGLGLSNSIMTKKKEPSKYLKMICTAFKAFKSHMRPWCVEQTQF